MSNFNAICSTWHFWPKAYRGLCWVSLTSRPCQGKMWSTPLRDEFLSTSHWGRALQIPTAARVPRSSGQKMPILLSLRILCSQAHSFPTSPAGCLEGNQKELAIKLVRRVGLHHGEAWPWLSCKKESSLQGTQPWNRSFWGKDKQKP